MTIDTRKPGAQVQFVLMWALAMSWVPFAVIAVVAALAQRYTWALGAEIIMCLWVLKLCDIFDLLERGKDATPAG